MFMTSQNENRILYDRLKNHFGALLFKDFQSNDSKKNDFLVTMESCAPLLNLELAKSILGEDQLKQILEED